MAVAGVGGQNDDLVFNGNGVSVWRGKNVLRVDGGGWLYRIMNYTAPLSCILKFG